MRGVPEKQNHSGSARKLPSPRPTRNRHTGACPTVFPEAAGPKVSAGRPAGGGATASLQHQRKDGNSRWCPGTPRRPLRPVLPNGRLTLQRGASLSVPQPLFIRGGDVRLGHLTAALPFKPGHPEPSGCFQQQDPEQRNVTPMYGLPIPPAGGEQSYDQSYKAETEEDLNSYGY
jgi:hypothetical protein